VTPADPLPFDLREGTEADRPFIFDTWLLSAKDSQPARQAGRHFVAWHKAEMRGVLSWPSTVVRVCCPEDDPDTILGWTVKSLVFPERLYYVYVRANTRRLGISKMLVADLLDRRDVLCAARLPRERDGQGWRISPVAEHVPSTWRYVPQIMTHEP